jgi:hypothetical protein
VACEEVLPPEDDPDPVDDPDPEAALGAVLGVDGLADELGVDELGVDELALPPEPPVSPLPPVAPELPPDFPGAKAVMASVATTLAAARPSVARRIRRTPARALLAGACGPALYALEACGSTPSGARPPPGCESVDAMGGSTSQIASQRRSRAPWSRDCGRFLRVR